MASKEKRIVATGYVIVGTYGAQSVALAPGEYVVFDEDNVSHQETEREIAAGKQPDLEIQEVDLKKELKSVEAQEELQEDLSGEEEVVEELQADVEKAAAAATEGSFDPADKRVVEVLEYLAGASPEEVERVKKAEARSDRNSKMVADFESA